jgi:hypothetical protein
MATALDKSNRSGGRYRAETGNALVQYLDTALTKDVEAVSRNSEASEALVRLAAYLAE